MTVAIVGSRSYEDYNNMRKRMLQNVNIEEIDMIISGGAYGADSLAERFAKEFGIPFTAYIAKWDEYGRSAGYKRNVIIVDNADMVIAFWNKKSRGTKHTIDIAKEKNIPCVIFPVKE